MDIVVIGAQKAGTTWLFSMLRQHPGVGFAFKKEVHYFDRIARADFDVKLRLHALAKSNASWSGKGRFYEQKYKQKVLDHNYAFTDQWYQDIFRLKPVNWWKNKIFGKVTFCDVTPSYCAMPEAGVRHMAILLPNITPILIIRDPVRRMISGHTMLLSRKNGRSGGGIGKQISKLRARQAPRGDYAHMIPLFRKYFSDLMIIPFGQIYTDPLSIMREIEQRYGLDTIRYKRLKDKRNSHTGKVELQPEVLHEIERICAPQYEYLRNEFDARFLAQL